MKAVLLAAGKSTRTYPLTNTRPKPLLPLLGKPLISYIIDGLKEDIHEWIIVTGFMEDMVQEYVKESFPQLSISFLSQQHIQGTGEAVSLLQKNIGDQPFLVLNGDDLYHPDDIRKAIAHPSPYVVLGKEVHDPSRFGVFRMNTQGELLELVEKPKEFVSNYANVGVYKFDGGIFSYTLPLSPRGEYEVTDYINALIQDRKTVHVLPITHYWLPITYPWDILHAQSYFLEKADIAYRVDPSSTIHDTVFLGKNVSIGKNCTVGENVEIDHSCLMDNVVIESNCRISGSVLGEGTIVKADSILDGSGEKEVMLPISGKEPIAITPKYKGVFATDKSVIEGFYTQPTFIS